MKWSEIKKDEDFLKILLVFVGIIILGAGFTVIQLYFKLFTNLQKDYFISFFWIFAIFPLIFYLLYLKKLGWMSFSEIGIKYKESFSSILQGLIVGIVIGLISWVLLGLLDSPVGTLPSGYIYIFIFSSVISAPIREEILTRGLFWSLIKRMLDYASKVGAFKASEKRKQYLTVIFVSFLFLSLHIGRPPEILFTTLLIDSFAYSLIYFKTKNLFAPITAHAISNLFIILRTIVF